MTPIATKTAGLRNFKVELTHVDVIAKHCNDGCEPTMNRSDTTLFTQHPRETVRKVPNAPAAWSSRTPKRGLSAHFFLRILAKSMLGALLVPPFRTVSEGVFSEVNCANSRASRTRTSKGR
jgi:hypothetical protein